MNEVLRRQVEDDCPILHFDMREHSFTDAHSFLDSMQEQVVPWTSSIAKHAAKFVSVVDTPYFNFKDIDKIYSDSRLSTPEKVRRLFSCLSTSLPQYSFWTGRKCPILFIHEANLMSNLTATKEGKIVLMQLLTF